MHLDMLQGFMLLIKVQKLQKKMEFVQFLYLIHLIQEQCHQLYPEIAEKNLIGIGFTNADALLLSFNSKNLFLAPIQFVLYFQKKIKRTFLSRYGHNKNYLE